MLCLSLRRWFFCACAAGSGDGIGFGDLSCANVRFAHPWRAKLHQLEGRSDVLKGCLAKR